VTVPAALVLSTSPYSWTMEPTNERSCNVGEGIARSWRLEGVLSEGIESEIRANVLQHQAERCA